MGMKQETYDNIKQLIDSGRIKVDIAEGTIQTRRRYNEYKTPFIICKPYARFNIFLNGKHLGFNIHQVVMVASGENPVDKEINHINGIKTDNRRSNLEVCTRSENQKHFYKMYYDKLLN